jgi:hypothetical protein
VTWPVTPGIVFTGTWADRLDRMHRGNLRRRVRGRWTQEEVDAINAEAKRMAEELRDFIE